MKEDVDGKPIFVSEFPVDNDAVFAEQMPIIRKDGSLFTFYRAKKGQKFAESFDGGKTWKLGGYYPMQFSINTKCILKTLPSGRVLLVANDVQMKDERRQEQYTSIPTKTVKNASLKNNQDRAHPHDGLLK